MSRTAVAALALMLPLVVQARDPDLLGDVVALRLPGMEAVKVLPAQPFPAAEGTTLPYDLFLPKDASPNRPLPLVVFVNGVGETEIPLRRWGVYQSWGRLVAASGMAAVTHDSRRAHLPEDLDALVTHLRANAGKLGIDPEQVALWSSSANVRTAFAYAADPSRTFLRSAVFYYGNLDKHRVRQDLPVLVMRAGLDMAWANRSIDAYAARALALDAPVTVVNLPGAIHAFDVFDDNEQSRRAIRQTLDFLEANFSRELQAARLERADGAKGIYFAGVGDNAAALRHLRAHLATAPDDRSAKYRLAGVLYQQKAHAEAGDLYEALGADGYVPGLTLYNAACCRALVGRKDDALALLARARQTGQAPSAQDTRADADLASLIGDPRFDEILAR